MTLPIRPKALPAAELAKIESVWQAPGLKATLISVFCAFGGWAILLPVIPLAIIEAGGSETMAGASTGIFMGATVATQYFTPRILRKVGYFPVMATAGLLLGLPALLHISSMSNEAVIAVAIIRGIGFGAVTVAEAALIADLVPLHLLGRSSGIFGVFVGSSQLIGFPLGMWVYDNYGSAVYVLAAVYAVVGAAAALGLPVESRDVTEATHETTEVEKFATPVVATWKLATVPGLLIGVAAVGFAAFSNFLAPAAAKIDPAIAATVAGLTLAVLGAAQTIARAFSGWWSDRKGEPGSLAVASLIFALAGVLGAAVTINMEPTGRLLVACALLTAAIFGAGFGLAQSEALLLLFYRLPRDRSAEASALWNMSFDSGTGVGSILLGIVASSFAFQGAFIGAGIVILVGLGLVVLDRFMGQHRVVDTGNVRTRLRRVTNRVRVRRR